MRASLGGFAVRIGTEKDGAPPPREDMKLIGVSSFGTSFFTVEKFGAPVPKEHFWLRRNSLNWNPQLLIPALIRIGLSINNVIRFGKAANGVQGESAKLLFLPADEEVFEEPSRGVGVTSFSMDLIVPDANITAFSKQDLLSRLNAVSPLGNSAGS
jgi:hypothetical protein